MLNVSIVAWAATLGLIGGLLALDLVVAARRPGAMGLREAVAWSCFYIAAALLFGVVFGVLAGWRVAGEYYAGFVVEKALSVDNLFVFVTILAGFAVPVELQRRALTLGIVVALLLRAVFIALGATLLEAFSFMFLGFGLLLLLTAVQIVRHRNEEPAIEDNLIVNAIRRAVPIADEYHGSKLVIREGGHRVATPLLLVLLALATTDLLFAFDSIPAVFGVTQHAYVVFCANAFALIGLRSLYFLVAGVLDRLIYLSTGLALILALIGVKLILHFAHTQNGDVPEIGTGPALGAIVIVLGATTVTSLVAARRDPSRRARAATVVRRRGDPPAPARHP